MRYKIEGTALNRYLVVEWKKAKWLFSSSEKVSFQVRLYEGNSGKITFRYNKNGNDFEGDNRSASVGLASGTNSSNYAYVGFHGQTLSQSSMTTNSARANQINKLANDIENYIFKFELPTCLPVSSIQIDSVNYDYARLKWTEAFPIIGSTFELDYSFQSENVDPNSSSANLAQNVSTPYVLSSLTADTTYKVSIRR